MDWTLNNAARCDTCGWYDEDTGVCCCADSAWCADFPIYPHDLCCRHWKSKEDVQNDAE